MCRYDSCYTFPGHLPARAGLALSRGTSGGARAADGEGRFGFGECVPRDYVTGETIATRFCEGSFGTFLLEHDIGLQDLTFGPGGKAPALDAPGLGVEIDEDGLAGLVTERMTIGQE